MTDAGKMRALRDDADLEALAGLMASGFGSSLEDSRKWIEKNGRGGFRLLDLEGGATGDGGLAACVGILPMGQFFGGRPVKSAGIAAVTVAPAHRGRGHALSLMQQTLVELRGQGCAVSSLFPATWHLYRRCGYELAGARNKIDVAVHRMPRGNRDRPARSEHPGDDEAVRACYRELARERPGWIDRSDVFWMRIRTFRDEPLHRIVIPGEDGGIDGYAYFRLVDRPDGFGFYDLSLSDVQAATEAATERLFALIHDHASLAGEVRFFGGCDHPLIARLPDRYYKLTLMDHWMLRILDVEAALATRGWAPGRAGEVHLRVNDPLFEQNSGDWRLIVEGGQAQVQRGGTGALRLDIRGLAGLYTGHLDVAVLAGLGLLEGDETQAALFESLCAGRPCSMVDAF